MWRLPLIIVFTGLITAMVWTMLYFWGFSKPIFKYQPMAMPTSKLFVKSRVRLEDPNVGYFIEIRYQEPHFMCYDLPCQSLDFPSSIPYILNFDVNQEGIHLKFSQAFAAWSRNKNILLVSGYPTLIQSIKAQFPLWQYGTSEGEWVRFKIFQSLGLIHLPEMKGDIWTSPLKNHHQTVVDDVVVAEMVRRSRQVVVGPISREQEYRLVQGLGVHGVVVELDLYHRVRSGL